MTNVSRIALIVFGGKKTRTRTGTHTHTGNRGYLSASDIWSSWGGGESRGEEYVLVANSIAERERKGEGILSSMKTSLSLSLSQASCCGVCQYRYSFKADTG